MSRLTVALSVSEGTAEISIGYDADTSDANRDDLFARSQALLGSVCRRVDAPTPTVADVRESIAVAQLQRIADHVAKVIDLDEHDLIESVGILCVGFTPGHDARVRRDRKRLDAIGAVLDRYDEGGDGDYDQRADALGQRALKGEADAKLAFLDRDRATALIAAIETVYNTGNGHSATQTHRRLVQIRDLIADYRAPKVVARDTDVPF